MPTSTMPTSTMLDIQELNPNQKNILSVWVQASTVDKSEGSQWYARALVTCHRIARDYNCGTKYVAGVVAALSPNVRWERNLSAAEELVQAYTYDIPLTTLSLPCYKANVLKAWEIINGEEPLDILGGNKVRAFYKCILELEPDSVCVDGHAYSIWQGQRLPMKQVPRLVDKLYKQISDDYVTVAKYLHVSPEILQATTWVTWRRLHNIG